MPKPRLRVDPQSTANMLLCDALGQLGNPLAVNRFLTRVYGIDFRATARNQAREASKPRKNATTSRQ